MSQPVSGWQQCGEGFLGVDKLKCQVSNVRDRISMRNMEINNSESRIVTDVTPEDKRCKKQGALRDVTLNPKSRRRLSSTVWKQADFLEEFSINDKASQKSDDINWSSSSSDDCLPNESCSEKLERASQNFSRKRKHYFPNISSDAVLNSKSQSNRSQLPVISDSSSSKSRNPSVPSEICLSPKYLNPCHGEYQGNMGHSNTVAESGNSTLVENMPKLITSFQPRSFQKINRKQNEIVWTVPSFNNDSRTAAAAAFKAAIPVTGNFKLKGRHDSVLPLKGKCVKSRVVQRLCIEASQELVGQISDVESDADEMDIVTSQDVGNEILPNVNPCSRDGKLELGPDFSLHADGQEEETTGSQINISSGTSSSGTSAQSEKMRASDWIKVLQKQKTPLKVDQEKNSQEDSSKKKRKYAQGSFADQLLRLINREKASVRFWYHSVKGGTFDEKSNKYLQMKLLSLEKQFSVVMSRCRLMEESVDAVSCRAVFTCETVEKLCLKPGMTVQVFAPWHQLEESNGLRTILCTNFVRVSSYLNPDPGASEVSKNDVVCRLSASANWSCPCSKDSRLLTHACPAATCPVVTRQISQIVGCPGSSILPSAKLQTVAALEHPCAAAVSRKTLLESLEAMRSDGPLLPSFSANVLRVFRRRVKGTLKQSLQLLVEDSAGTLAIVKCSDEFGDVPGFMYTVEGKTCTFSCLHVASRTNRDNEPALFGMVDQVWRQQLVRVSSQQSGSEASQLQLRTEAPSFAYVLHSAPGGTWMSAEEKDDIAKEVILNLLTLKQVVRDKSGIRVSFIAKVLLPPRFSQVSGSANVNVYDTFNDIEGNSAVQKVEMGSECVMEDSATAVYLFRDVLLLEGHLQCDSYTLVLDMPAWTMWNVHNRIDSSIVASVLSSSVKLAHVCDLSEPGNFVSLQGNISEIDESLSFSWEECEACGSDRLATSEESGATYCIGCNRQVMTPVFRMRMEVYVTCKSSSSHLVAKVDLTQKTIESLLPSELSEEGHDTQLVIGKQIKCPACLVQSRLPDHFTDTSTDPKTVLMLMELQC